MTSTNILIKTLLREPQAFARFASGIKMRRYQQGVMESVFYSVLNARGLSFVVMFPRQSGKNELQAHLEVFLMALLSQKTTEFIKVTPTKDPQAKTGMRRFEKVAKRNILIKNMWQKDGDNAYKIGQSRLTFLSAAPGSNIVGATASGLLEVDEAQQVSIEKYDRDIAPMSASTCATHVFWGTAWTSTTLLGRELRAAEEAEKKDGVRRVFKLTAEDVMAEVEAYRKHVDVKIARFGRTHPMVRTQYFSEEVDSEGGMFPAERQGRMTSTQAAYFEPKAGGLYALLLDVAGEDEGVRGLDGSLSMANPARDATALTLVEIQFDEKEPQSLPIYQPIKRWQWIGENHVTLRTMIRDIALEWKVRAVVVDATGVGAGLASFLGRALPGRVTPFTFNSASKSKLGWDFLAIVDSGRWQEPVFADLPGDDQAGYQKEFFMQLSACQYEVSGSATHTMKWGVPESARNPVSGEPLHDDWILSAALCGVLEKMDLRSTGPAFIISGKDPLKEMDKGF